MHHLTSLGRLPTPVSPAVVVLLAALLAAAPACKRHGPPSNGPAATPPPTSVCGPDRAVASAASMPSVSAEMLQLDYWMQSLGDADTPLLGPQEIARLNATNAQRPSAFQDVTQAAIGAQKSVDQQIKERHEWLASKLTKGKYVELPKGALHRTKTTVIDSATRVDELHVLVKPAALRCIPMHAQFQTPPDSGSSSSSSSSSSSGSSASSGQAALPAPFDRNQCSGVHAGELVRALRRSADGAWFYVHTGHSVGWLHRPSWTPELSALAARAYRDKAPRLVVTAPQVTVVPDMTLAMGATLPIISVDGDTVEVEIPTTEGIESHRLVPPEGVSVGYLPFTRRNLYARALAYLDHPYGWGETDSGQDCSRLMLDVFATSGVTLGRHSAEQANAGIRTMSLKGLDQAGRHTALRQAMSEGVVFAYMPGHIMLMLGEREGRFFAVSAIAEVRELCARAAPTGSTTPISKTDRALRIGRVVVSDLQLGIGTSKTSFVERLTKLAVFGPKTN